jgi:hypothetical protein
LAGTIYWSSEAAQQRALPEKNFKLSHSPAGGNDVRLPVVLNSGTLVENVADVD